jgi:hypothetical protein
LNFLINQQFGVFMKYLAVLVSTAFAFNALAAPVCPPSNAVNIQGIGDGCTTLIASSILPDIGRFKSQFTASCNAHDKCYTTLGASYGKCDGEFLANMRNSCDSMTITKTERIGAWLGIREATITLPHPEQPACKLAANKYYGAVSGWGSAVNPLPSMQNEAMYRSYLMEQKVLRGECETTPENTTLYSAELIAKVNSIFASYTNRLPSMPEFFRAINGSGSTLNNPQWETRVGQFASTMPKAVVPIPKIFVGSLTADQRLNEGDMVSSPSRNYSLKMVRAGLQLLNSQGAVVWTLGSYGANTFLTMQSDGNFVLYNINGTPLWHAQTYGNPGAYLAVQDDGNVVVYSRYLTPLWSSMGGTPAPQINDNGGM